jgi:small subunit ribosomal protein S16
MAVTIRLSRIGTKHVPFFRIVAVDSRKKRDGEFIENLGTYDAVKSQLVQFHEDRVNHWVAQGAQMTDAVKKLQRMHKEASKVVPEAPKKAEKAPAKKAQVVAEAAQDAPEIKMEAVEEVLTETETPEANA